MFLQVSVCPHRGGACMVLFGGGWGGMHGFIWGACVVLFGGGMHGFIWGHAWFYSGVHGFIRGGHVWFYSGGVRGFIRGACVVLFRGGMRGFIWGVHGFIWGVCIVLFGGCAWFYSGGHAWFYLGGMRGFIQGGHAWFFQFFRIQWDTVNERAVRILLECILVFQYVYVCCVSRIFSTMSLGSFCHRSDGLVIRNNIQPSNSHWRH